MEATPDKQKISVQFYSPENLSQTEFFKLPECIEKEARTENDKIYAGIEKGSDPWIEMACKTAVDSVKNGGGPFGCVILQIDKATDRIIRFWKNHNQVTSINDPTAHAEVMTIRSVCQDLGVFDLGEIHQDQAQLPQPSENSYCVIYSSCEPCPMCYSAINWARIPVLLFAATRFDAAVDGVDFSDEAIYEELKKSYKNRDTVCGHCNPENAQEAFELWKKIDKIPY